MTDRKLSDDEVAEMQHRLASAEAIIVMMREAIDRVTGVALTEQFAHVYTMLDWFPTDYTLLNEYLGGRTTEPVITLDELKNCAPKTVIMDYLDGCYQNISLGGNPVWSRTGLAERYTSEMLWDRYGKNGLRKIFKQNFIK